MQKNFAENIQPIQVDPITGQYYVIIPEWITNEFSWYENTEIKFGVEGNDVVITEHEYQE